MCLWALLLEFATYSEEGAVGDWRYQVPAWLDDGMPLKHLELLNSIDQLGWVTGDDEVEIPTTDKLVMVVEHYVSQVAELLRANLGDAFTFAYLWSTRMDAVTYPLSADLIDDIVNDPTILHGDPNSKIPAYMWVEQGMNL